MRGFPSFETIDGRPTLAATATENARLRLPPFEAELALGAWWITTPEREEG